MERLDLLRAAGVALTGAVAGCGAFPPGDDSNTTTATGTEWQTSQPVEQAVENPETNEDGSYSVSIEPMGEVTFESIPETWVGNNGSWADMAVALGVEPPEAVWLPSRFHTHYYDDIPNVSIDGDSISALSSDGVSKEQFYTLDGDVHVMDPNFLINRFDWEQSDVDEISEIAPLFGNSGFTRNYDWHSDYRYYTIEEAFEKLAKVFHRADQFNAMVDVRNDFFDNIASVVPDDASDRPDVAVVWGGDQPDTFYPYHIGGGTSYRQLRDLQVGDALAKNDVPSFYQTRGQIDYETLLEADPDVLLVRGHESKSRAEFEANVISYMENDDTASALSAVSEGEVYRGGPLYQGPITNMVVAERQAGQLYGADEDLFDRQRVGEIVNGNL